MDHQVRLAAMQARRHEIIGLLSGLNPAYENLAVNQPPGWEADQADLVEQGARLRQELHVILRQIPQVQQAAATTRRLQTQLDQQELELSQLTGPRQQDDRELVQLRIGTLKRMIAQHS